MTNTEQFKKDTEELYAKIKGYQSAYPFTKGGKTGVDPLAQSTHQLRGFLEIVWTDGELKAQHSRDGMM